MKITSCKQNASDKHLKEKKTAFEKDLYPFLKGLYFTGM